ncbi:hypothetical protein F3Y22_tig00111358pilonHSYRG00098 [Hibiscus syriacus]|uniref:Protein kinase domain-containing protein n=1 Tax=Hibiscus syriacus TaxID=106335 RepID=A0A6A2YNP6_HIBSY|nr:hypothetical protein F3Y22_tig00111358pilonHSYRG00098 [Hibiscus syriacus]
MIGKMGEGTKFTGLLGGTNNNGNNYYDFTKGFTKNLVRALTCPLTVYRRVTSSVFHPGKVGHASNDDALAQALMDSRSFGKLYRGTYNGDNVAIKILERPENSPEKAQVMEQQFQQELMMLATLKHSNIVRFIGACLKQALDVARGMAYVHGLGFIHRDLKSDNLLIAAEKSIKIADFGVARIEVQTEGMTPETGTYRWMAPYPCILQYLPFYNITYTLFYLVGKSFRVRFCYLMLSSSELEL